MWKRCSGSIENARQQNAQQSPRASSQLAEARKELQEFQTPQALGRSAYDIERGRVAQAASNDPVITDTLRRLQQNLQAAADTASWRDRCPPGGAPQPTKPTCSPSWATCVATSNAPANSSRRRTAMAPATRVRVRPMPAKASVARPAANAASRASKARASSQDSSHGQGGSQQQQANNQQQRGQGGQNGNQAGGRGNQQVAGGGTAQWWRRRVGWRPQPAGGDGTWDGTDFARTQRLSAERLAEIRAQLANGVLTAADMDLLIDLEKRLQRGQVDPMSAEYQKMTTLVSQLELAALKAAQAKDNKKPTRTDDTVDDSRRYRDNVAEYYRRLGGGNE